MRGVWRFVLAAMALVTSALLEPNPTNSQKPSEQLKLQEILTGARKEGKLVLVTTTTLAYREIVQKFKEKYPSIEVEHVTLRPSAFAPRVVTEQRNGVFAHDVWLATTSNMHNIALPAGVFQKMSPFLIVPEVKEPKNWRTGHLWYTGSEPYILINQGRVSGTVEVNRKLLSKEEFNSLEQLLNPKLKRKISIRTPSAPHGGSLVLAGFLHHKGEEFVRRLLTEMEPVFVGDARLNTNQVINGKFPIAIGTDNRTLNECRNAGGCSYIEEIGGFPYLLTHGVAVLKNAPHPNAATLFINWFLSREGQQVYVDSEVKTLTPPFDSAHSGRADVKPHPDAVQAGTVPDYKKLNQYSLQGHEQGEAQMKRVLELYREVERQRK